MVETNPKLDGVTGYFVPPVNLSTGQFLQAQARVFCPPDIILRCSMSPLEGILSPSEICPLTGTTLLEFIQVSYRLADPRDRIKLLQINHKHSEISQIESEAVGQNIDWMPCIHLFYFDGLHDVRTAGCLVWTRLWLRRGCT